MNETQVPGKPSWYFTENGIFRTVMRGTGPARKPTPEEVIDWCPKVTRYVVGKTVDGETIRTRYTVRVGDQVRTFSQDELRDGKAWDNYHVAAGQGDKQVCSALADIVRYQGRGMGETLDCPVWVGDDLVMPPSDLMPDGYSKAHNADKVADLIGIAADNPKLALVMGMSYGAPYVAPLKRQAFVVHLPGTAGQGKTTGMWAAASMWGKPEIDGGLIPSWNATQNGVTARLGRLAVLPAFLDDIHAAGFTPEKLNTTLFAITQGAGRLRADRNGEERKSRYWSGVLFSSGNTSILGMLGSKGEVARRVVEIPAPIVNNGATADAVKVLAQTNYGTFAPVPIAAMADALAWAERKLSKLLTGDASGVNVGIMRCLALGVAGAWHLGGEDITRAALEAAGAVLLNLVAEAAEAGVTTGEKLLEAARQLVVASPVYPTRKDRAGVPSDRPKPTIHGFYEHPDLYVMTTYIDEIAKHAGLADARVALRELKASGHLVTTPGSKHLRRQFRVSTERFNVYHLRLGVTVPAGEDPLPVIHDYPFIDDEIGGVSGVTGVSAGQSTNQPSPVGGASGVSGVSAGRSVLPWPATTPGTTGQPEVVAADKPVTRPDTTAAPDTTQSDPSGVRPVTPLDRKRAARVADESEQLAHFAQAIGGKWPNVTEAQLLAGLRTFSTVMKGLTFGGPASLVGQRLFQRCEAQFASVPVLGPRPEVPDLKARVMFNLVDRNQVTLIPAKPLVVGMDVNAQFLAVTESVALGTGDPVLIRTGEVLMKTPETVKRLKNRAGYVQLANATFMGPGCMLTAGTWIANPAAEYLVQRDGSLEVVERYEWPESRRWLSAWGRQMKAGRRDLVAHGSPAAAMALDALKSIYSVYLGGFMRSTRYNRHETLRPDWADQLQTLARVNALRGLMKCHPKPIGTLADAAYFLLGENESVRGLEVEETTRQPGKWKVAQVGRSGDQATIERQGRSYTTTLAIQLEQGSVGGIATVVRALDEQYRKAASA